MPTRISKWAKVKFMKANMDVSLCVDCLGTRAQSELVRRARATFKYSVKTASEDILMSLSKTWKEYQDGKVKEEESSDE